MTLKDPEIQKIVESNVARQTARRTRQLNRLRKALLTQSMGSKPILIGVTHLGLTLQEIIPILRLLRLNGVTRLGLELQPHGDPGTYFDALGRNAQKLGFEVIPIDKPNRGKIVEKVEIKTQQRLKKAGYPLSHEIAAIKMLATAGITGDPYMSTQIQNHQLNKPGCAVICGFMHTNPLLNSFPQFSYFDVSGQKLIDKTVMRFYQSLIGPATRKRLARQQRLKKRQPRKPVK